MKKIVLSLLCIGMAVSFVCTGCGQKAGEKLPIDYEGNAVIGVPARTEDWLGPMIDLFHQEYPGISIAIEPIPIGEGGNGYLPNLAKEMAAGQGPDIIYTNTYELAMAKELDWFEDLSLPPYDYDAAQLIDYLSKYLHDGQDRLIGLPMSYEASIYMYRRDVARRYLGTDDPDALAALMSSWNAFLIQGEDIRVMSEGKAYIFYSLVDLLSDIWHSNPNPLFQDGDILLSENYIDQIALIRRLCLSDIAPEPDDLLSWLTSSIRDESVVFYACYPDLMQAIQRDVPETLDQWVYMMPPVPTGSHYANFIHLNKNSANKEAAYQFIYYLFGSEKGNIARYQDMDVIPVLKSLYEGDRLNFYAAAGSSVPVELYRRYIEESDFPQVTIYDMLLTGIAWGIRYRLMDDPDLTDDQLADDRGIRMSMREIDRQMRELSQTAGQ